MIEHKGQTKPFVSIRKGAQIAGVDYSTFKYWVDNEHLPSIVINEKGWRLVPLAALQRFLVEGKA